MISRHPRDRTIAFTVTGVAVVLSLGMAAVSDYQGLFQRLIFTVAFAWLLYVTDPDYALR